jgi:hypothetical protein
MATMQIDFDNLHRWAREGRLYAVLDACDAPAILSKLASLPDQKFVSLFRGGDEELSKVAPYLIRLDEPILEWIRVEIWNEPWGIFVVADSSLDLVRKHLRKFLVVKGPEGDILYFRYYDPRVLPVFLETCDAEQLRSFFGLLHAFAYTKLGDVFLIRKAI